MIRKSPQLRQISRVLTSKFSSQDEVGTAAVTAFKIFYSGQTKHPMHKIRYNKYMEMASQGTIAPEKLPPTAQSARYHGLRVHHQVMTWSLIEGLSFDPLEWGWKKNDEAFVPITNNLDIAPQSLQNIIRCSCKLTSKNPCSTKACTCVKYGMPCLPSCTGCRGEDCHNVQADFTDELDPEEDSVETTQGQEYDNIFDILTAEFYDVEDAT